MAEYIDRDNLIKDFECDGGRFVYGDYVPAIVSRIKIQSVVDVESVRHAKWEWQEDIFGDCTYICSYCGEPWILLAGTPESNNMNYCPCCGAKMDL